MSCRSWTHDKVQIKQALESNKKNGHKDAQKNSGIHDSSHHCYLVRILPKQNCGPFIINVLSFHMHLLYSATWFKSGDY